MAALAEISGIYRCTQRDLKGPTLSEGVDLFFRLSILPVVAYKSSSEIQYALVYVYISYMNPAIPCYGLWLWLGRKG